MDKWIDFLKKINIQHDQVFFTLEVSWDLRKAKSTNKGNKSKTVAVLN